MADGGLDYKVAILGFKAVYTLERKRRENDKKILAVYVECAAPNLTSLPASHKS